MASSISDILFGSSPSVTDKPIYLQSSLSPQQSSVADLLTNVLGGNTSWMSSLSTFPSYSGKAAAPVSTATNQSVNALASMLSGVGNAASGVGGVQSTGLNTLNSILGSSSGDLQGYYNQNVFSPLMSTFLGNTVGDIVGATGGADNRSGQQGSTLGTALSNFGTQLGSTQGQLSYDTGQQTAKNILSALGLSSSVTQAPSSALSSILGMGTTAQTAEQSMLNQLFKNYQTGTSNTQQFLSDLASYLGVQTQTAANQNVAVSGSSGLLGSLLSGVGKAIGGSLTGGSK